MISSRSAFQTTGFGSSAFFVSKAADGEGRDELELLNIVAKDPFEIVGVPGLNPIMGACFCPLRFEHQMPVL